MRRLCFGMSAAILFAIVLIVSHPALAQTQVWTWLDKAGNPRKIISCGGCKGSEEKCKHQLASYSEDSIWRGRIKPCKLRWHYITRRGTATAIFCLAMGGQIMLWEKKVLFSYKGKCLCTCPDKSHGGCGGHYPNPWWAHLLLWPRIFVGLNAAGFKALPPDKLWKVLPTPKGTVKHKGRKVKLSMAPCNCCKLPPKKKALPKKKSTPKKHTMLLPRWPSKDGVLCTFIPSGENYGNIGDLAITNTTDQPVTVTVPPGLLLDSSNPGVQDLYVADVPTRTPCGGAAEIGKPIAVGAGETHIINDIPGFCPDFELKPPDKGIADIYTTRPPDEKAKTLLATIQAVKEFDVSKIKLEVFEKDQTREMLAQGALWMADSQVDDIADNEVTPAALTDRYWDTFASSAGKDLAKMAPAKRKEAEDLVKEDLKKIVAATSFIAKKRAPG